jgi:hypothetical protein
LPGVPPQTDAAAIGFALTMLIPPNQGMADLAWGHSGRTTALPGVPPQTDAAAIDLDLTTLTPPNQ